jgi:hypothetical protein
MHDRSHYREQAYIATYVSISHLIEHKGVYKGLVNARNNNKVKKVIRFHQLIIRVLSKGDYHGQQELQLICLETGHATKSSM